MLKMLTIPRQFRLITKRSMHLLQTQAFINGKWLGAQSGQTFPVTNPATGKVIASVANLTTSETQQAIESASKAFEKWQDTTPKQRSCLLRAWYDLLVKHSEDIANILTAESGKPISEALTEVNYGNSFVEFYSGQATKIHGEILASPVANKKILVEKQPIGAVGLITPWNFPHAMITRKAGAALAAGCTCVVKPAEDTPLTALALIKLAEEAGFPPGVINVVTSDRMNASDIGKLLCSSPLVAGISFTGSTQVGKLLYSQCSGQIKRLGLELGGNAPFIVYESANIDRAVAGAMASKFRNCGQTCVASNRFLIQESIYEPFIAKLLEQVKSLKLGNGAQCEVQIGPLVNEAQFSKVSSLVQDAVDKGANILTGGKPESALGPLFYQPTVLENLNDKIILYNEEVFGPVISLIKFKDEEESLKIANDTNRGLAGYFYSEDVQQIFRVARKLEVGMVGVNEGSISSAEAPFGGIKESGLGREGSHYGIEDYVYVKYICLGNL